MTAAGAGTWSVPLEINNLGARINSLAASNVTNPLTANLLGGNFNIQGLSAPPAGTPFVVLTGGQEFLIETADLTPQISVDATGVHLGTPGTGYNVTAPTVSNPADNSTKVATTAFVQSAVTAGSSNVNSISTTLSGLTVSPTTGNVVISGTLGASSGGTGVTSSAGANSVALRDALQNIDAVTFTGDLVGNAATATTATTATNATNVQITNTNANATKFLSFVDTATTGLQGVQVDSGITCNPALNAITATTFNGGLNGIAASATKSTNLAGGVGGEIPYQTATDTTGLLPNGAAGQVLTSQGTTLPPVWTSVSAGVTSFSADGTGLLPAVPTAGAVTLSGVLNVWNGGTGVTASGGANSVVLRDAGQNVTAVTFIGDLSGNALTATTATNSTNVQINNTNANAVHYFAFANDHTTANYGLQATSGLSLNPNSASITATTFNGALNGNASTATTATTSTNIAGGAGGSVPYQTAASTTALLPNGAAGQVLTSQGTTLAPVWSTPSTAATTVGVTDTNAAGTYYPTFVSASGPGQTLRADILTNPLTYNPSTGVLTASGISSAYSATGITNLGGFNVINGAGIAATTFQGALQGNADTATLATTATNIAGGVIGNIPYQAGAGSTTLLVNGAAGTVLTSGGVGGIPTWTAPSTTATTVSITDTNTAGIFYPTFVSASGAGQTLRADITANPLTYNPNTGVLTSTNFTGSVTGLATQASAVTITDTNINATYYPVFVSAAGTNQTLRADIASFPLTYNPSTATLTAQTIVANASIKPATITDITNSTGGANSAVLTSGTGSGIVWGSAPATALYGTGADGNIYLDGSSATLAYSFVTYNSGTQTYTLTRDVYAIQFVLYSPNSLITAGYRIFATFEVNLSGTVSNNGGSAALTTGGTGGLGGYFRAGGTGATGLLAAAVAAQGTAPTLPTAATWVGSLGGRGASARSSTTTFVSTPPITVANFNASVPADVDGGRSIINNINFWYQRALATATALWQPSGGQGGASGGKSATGTAATSGGGGGGGGVVFIASPSIIASAGSIQAIGGGGGNGTGTGGIFGGGAGGAGGLIGIVTKKDNYNATYYTVTGGQGGSTANSGGTNSPVGASLGTGTSTSTNPLTIFPTSALSSSTPYIVALHIQGNAGSVPTITSMTGAGCGWNNYGDVLYTATRRLSVWVGTGISTYSADPRLLVYFSTDPVNVRYTYDAIYNTSLWEGINPIVQSTSATATATTTLTTTLPSVPTTNNMQYSVLARTGGTAPVAGTGNTLLTQGAVNPIMNSMVAISRQSNTQTWTTAADSAMVTIDFSIPTAYEPGISGESGRVVAFLV